MHISRLLSTVGAPGAKMVFQYKVVMVVKDINIWINCISTVVEEEVVDSTESNRPGC